MTDDLARLLVHVARDLERRGYAKAGVVHRAARALVEQADHDFHKCGNAVEGCARCGGEVTQPPTGRRRKYCTTCSPRRAKRSKTLHSDVQA